MTIKPFCIRTENLSGMEIASAIELCVKHRCIPYEGVDECSESALFDQLYDHNNFKFFGVDSRCQTVLWDSIFDFGNGAIEITIDQLPAHIGIGKTETPEEKEAFEAMSEKVDIDSWIPGDNCVFDNKPGLEFGDLTLEYINKVAVIHHLFINSNSMRMALIEFDDGYCCAVVQDCLSKPETPRQREKRENLELAYELYSFLCESKNNQPKNFENFKSVNHGVDAAAWVELVKLTNYRETKNGKK